jgi:hypothetical protein
LLRRQHLAQRELAVAGPEAGGAQIGDLFTLTAIALSSHGLGSEQLLEIHAGDCRSADDESGPSAD